MTDQNIGIISALVDQEPVDPDALVKALEDPDARAALVDFVRLRREVAAAPEPIPTSLATLRRPPFGRAMAIRWSAAAALLVLVFLAGWMAPRPFGSVLQISEAAPPQPARVEKFVPGVDWSFR